MKAPQDPYLVAAAVKRYMAIQLDTCFDPSFLDSRANSKQQSFLDDLGKKSFRWIVAGNQSGKTSTACREIAWILNGNHPTWVRPKEWGHEPLLIIVAGQDRRMIEVEIWGKKLLPFLNAADWKEIKQGGNLQYVENLRTKDKVVFLSHNDGSDKARTHMQGYVAHYVWCDELPVSVKILEELQRRVDARKGYFVASFTSKVRNDAVRKMVESTGNSSIGRIYRMSKFDNPIYADRIEEELQKLEGLPENYKRAIIDGDWYSGDNAVYHMDADVSVASPEDYHQSWRHVECSDPASAGKFGYTMWAEDPKDGLWYCIRADYIEGIHVPRLIFEEVMKRGAGLNIIRRICDPHEKWFIATASDNGVHYQTPFDKNNRKTELIMAFQNALPVDIRIAPWCIDFVNEIQTCQWSESGNGKIVNASSYHLLDCGQYFVDCKPKRDIKAVPKTWEQELRAGFAKKKVEEAKVRALGGRLKISRRGKWQVGPTGVRRLR